MSRISQLIRIAAGMSILLLAVGCEEDGDPKKVGDLRVSSVLGGSVTLGWTQVDDGTGAPANYLLGYGSPKIVWDSASLNPVTIVGTQVGAPIAYTVENLSLGASYEFSVASFRYLDGGSLRVAPPSEPAPAFVAPDFPGPITDLAVTSVTSTSVTIRWTQVTNGSNTAANYAVAKGTPTIDWNTALPTAVEVAGTQVGTQRTFTFSGLTPATAYQFQVAAIRGSLGASPEFGPIAAAVGATTTAVPPPPPAGAFFTDNFDTGARLNANGFTWEATGSRVAVTTEKPFSGTHSLRLLYGPDADLQDSNAEQRFNLGRNVTAIWIEYMLYVPDNYRHRAQPGTSVNNKVFFIWNTVYGSGSGTWQAGYEVDRASDSTSNIRPMSSKEFGTNATFVESSGLGHPDYGKPLFGPQNALKPGTWNRIRLQFARSSAAGATDGIMRFWIGDTMFAQMTNGPFRNFGNVGETVLRNGYFMGYSNSGNTAATSGFIDDVRFYETDPGWVP